MLQSARTLRREALGQPAGHLVNNSCAVIEQQGRLLATRRGVKVVEWQSLPKGGCSKVMLLGEGRTLLSWWDDMARWDAVAAVRHAKWVRLSDDSNAVRLTARLDAAPHYWASEL